MEEQHKEMLRNLVNGVYDQVEEGRSFQPGQLDMSAKKPAAPAPLQLKNVVPTPVKPGGQLPPEVLAARLLKEAPKENNVGVETLFGEDLISEKSLDEVILSYLASEGGS